MDDSIAMLIKADGFMGPLLPELFKKIPNIKKFHHFRFSRNELGIVYWQEFLSSSEQAFFSLKNGVAIPPVSVLPQKINPEGLSEERQNYLYREIRQLHQFHDQ